MTLPRPAVNYDYKRSELNVKCAFQPDADRKTKEKPPRQ